MYLLCSNLTNALGFTRFASDLRQMGTSEGGTRTARVRASSTHLRTSKRR